MTRSRQQRLGERPVTACCSVQAAEWGLHADRSAAETTVLLCGGPVLTGQSAAETKCAAIPIGSLAAWQALMTDNTYAETSAELQRCLGVQHVAAAGFSVQAGNSRADSKTVCFPHQSFAKQR